ncbi:MAG: hypothetical protein B5M46_00415 [Epsilonproteobacteria bacterium 4484_20]|nr:MAG: hypothetical protein B5M46_00415 [Epsilonproteobacteria bacterium 4484_20]
MLEVRLDRKNRLALLQPHDALSKEDFDNAVRIIDPFIEENGKLNGIIIYTESFPGWEDFAALSRHFTFIRNHHRKIRRLAFVTDTGIIDYTKAIAAPFIEAEIKVFPYTELDEAKRWAAGAEENA